MATLRAGATVPLSRRGYVATMARNGILVLYVLSMVALIVVVDILFFRDHVWARLMVNVGIVLIFGACYLRFFKG